MKICLIGSTRFIDKFLEWNAKLSKMGHVVYSVATRSSSADYQNKEQQQPTEDEKQILDLVHLLKIQNSDVVCLITDDSGYVGFSTKREIQWCLLNDKNILLPEMFRGVGDNFEAVTKNIQDALREQKNASFKSKFAGDIRI